MECLKKHQKMLLSVKTFWTKIVFFNTNNVFSLFSNRVKVKAWFGSHLWSHADSRMGLIHGQFWGKIHFNFYLLLYVTCFFCYIQNYGGLVIKRACIWIPIIPWKLLQSADNHWPIQEGIALKREKRDNFQFQFILCN